MTETRSQQFTAVFAPDTLTTNLPLRLMRDNLQEVLACSLGCAVRLFDRSIAQVGLGVTVELADPFKTHDFYCGQCGKRIS